jgi:hypothetical protein
MLASILGDGAISSRAVWIARSFDALITVDVDVDVDDVAAEPELRDVDAPQAAASTDTATAHKTAEHLIVTSVRTLL